MDIIVCNVEYVNKIDKNSFKYEIILVPPALDSRMGT